MQQLVFDLAPAEPPSFDNFVAGSNAEVLAAVKRFAAAVVERATGAGNPQTDTESSSAAPIDNTSLLLWGEHAAGLVRTQLSRLSVCDV